MSRLNFMRSRTLMSAAQPTRCCEFSTPPTALLTSWLRYPLVMMMGAASRTRAGSRMVVQPMARLTRLCASGTFFGYLPRLRNSESLKCWLSRTSIMKGLLVVEFACKEVNVVV